MLMIVLGGVCALETVVILMQGRALRLHARFDRVLRSLHAAGVPADDVAWALAQLLVGGFTLSRPRPPATNPHGGT